MPEPYAGGPTIVNSLRRNVTSQTAATYTVTTNDSVVLTNNAGGTTVTLPGAAAAGSGFQLEVANVGAAGTTSVQRAGADTVNGAAAAVAIAAQWQRRFFVSDGISNWIASGVL